MERWVDFPFRGNSSCEDHRLRLWSSQDEFPSGGLLLVELVERRRANSQLGIG